MLDADLALIYGVTTKRLNEQVKRNRDRFPADFMFRLTAHEKAEVVANCDHLGRLKFSSTAPYAFTEHGAMMLASVLNSRIAIDASVQIVRAFVRLREMLSRDKELARKLAELERRYDHQFRAVFSSLADVDSPTIAFKRGGPLGGGWRDPALAVAIASLGNALSKLVLGCANGNPKFRRRLSLALGVMVAAGTITVVVMRLKA